MKKLIIVLILSLLFISCKSDVPKTNTNNEDNTVDNNEILDEIDLEFETELAKIEEQERIDAENKKIDDDYNLVRELEDLEEDKKVGNKARGSCNKQTVDGGACLEYYGSFWTEQQMKLNCKGGGTFSNEKCPRTMDGGCNVGAGTQLDNVLWMYRLGASGESAVKVCNGNPLTRWISIK